MEKSNAANRDVKCDLHVHIDGKISKENIIKLLDNAERNGVKYLCILEHYNLDLYREGSALQELCRSGEVEKHYSGKLISGVEMTCIVDDGVVSSRTGYDYSGQSVHIVCLGFDVEQAERMVFNATDGSQRRLLKEGFLFEAHAQNDILLRQLLRERNLPEPPEGYFTHNTVNDSIEKQLYNYYYREHPEYGKIFDERYGTSENVSDFVRKYVEDPKGALHFHNIIYPRISQSIPRLRQLGIIALAHPAYMRGDYDALDYVETIMKYYGGIFDTIEVPYGQNTPAETEMLEQYARQHGMPLVAGGTDSCLTPNGQMYLIMDGEKQFYEMKVGVGRKAQLLGGKENGAILLPESELALFPDVREQGRFAKTRSEMGE